MSIKIDKTAAAIRFAIGDRGKRTAEWPRGASAGAEGRAAAGRESIVFRTFFSRRHLSAATGAFVCDFHSIIVRRPYVCVTHIRSNRSDSR